MCYAKAFGANSPEEIEINLIDENRNIKKMDLLRRMEKRSGEIDRL